MNTNKEKKTRKLGLTTWIFIALLSGMAVGCILHYLVPDSYIKNTIIIDGVFNIVGNGFLRLMQMLVVPLVFCSIVCGSSAIGDTKTLGKVGVKTVAFYLCTTACAIIVALSVALLIKPGVGIPESALKTTESVETIETTSLTDTILNIIPKNPIQGLAEGNMLQIILFAIIIGIILAKLGEKTELVSNFFAQFNTIMMEMTNMVMSLAPIGVFCLIAKTFSGIGFSVFLPLIKYMLSVLTGLGVHLFVVYSIMFFLFTRLNPYHFIRKYLPVMGFAFSTATSNATIPLAIETLSSKMGVSKKISSFTIPLGATVNMDGTAIMQGVAVVFASEAFNIPLTGADYATVILTATLASIGTAGVPSVGLVTLTMVFASVGLPTEAIALIMGIDRLLDMARTTVNITGDALCTSIVAFQDKSMDVSIFKQKQ